MYIIGYGSRVRVCQVEFQTTSGVLITDRMSSRPPKPNNIGGSGSHLKASEQGSHLNASKLSASKIKASDLRKSSMAGVSEQDAMSMMKASHMSGTKVRKLEDQTKELDQNGNKIRIKEVSLVQNTMQDPVTGFDDPNYYGKNIRQVELTALAEQRELIKDSNYFDESRDDGRSLNLSNKPSQADFRTGKMESFTTCRVKTFLYDRHLSDKISS